jgi:hypothetical protein
MAKSFPENIVVWVDEGEEGWRALESLREMRGNKRAKESRVLELSRLAPSPFYTLYHTDNSGWLWAGLPIWKVVLMGYRAVCRVGMPF